MSQPRTRRRRHRALTAAALLLPSPAFAATYDLNSKTIDLSTSPYTAADTLNCNDVTFTSALSATLPASLNLVGPYSTTVSNTGSITLTGPLAGTAPLYKTGTGSLTLSAPSPSFTGRATIISGTLRLTDPAALGPASAPTPVDLMATLDVSGALPARPVYLDGATLSNDNTASPATVGPALTVAPGTFAFPNAFTLSGAGDLTFASPLPAADFLQKRGTGTATYSTPTAFANSINVSAGTLRLGTESPFAGSAAPAVVVSGTASLDLNGFSSSGLPVSLSSTASLVNNNPTTPSTLAAFPSGTVINLGGAGALNLTATLPTTRSFTKVGAGTLTLSADNTSYAGSITVAAGSLRLGNAAGAGNSGVSNPNSSVRLSAGGQFDLNGFTPPRVQVYFEGGALVNDNTATPVTLASTSLPVLFVLSGTLTLGGAGEIIATRSLGTFTKVGTGPLTLNRAGGTISAATVNAGTLRLGRSDAIASGATVTANLGGALDLNGFPMPAGVTVTLNDGGIVNNNTATPVTLSAAPTYAPNTHYPCFGGDGTLNLNFSVSPDRVVHKVGTGLLTIPTSGFGANMLIIDAGLVQIESDAQLARGIGDNVELNGGGIRVGPLALAPLSTYTFTNGFGIESRGGTIDTRANTVFTGTGGPYAAPTQPKGTLTKTGTANLSLNGTYPTLYNFPITVNQGTLSVSNPSYHLSQTALTLNADNALTGSTFVTLGALAGTGALANVSVTTGALNLETTYAGAFTNGSLTTTGTGSLTLTGPVAGPVNVNTGTLQVGDGHTTGSVAGNLNVGPTAQVTFNRAGDVTHTGNFTGSGTLNKLAANTLTLTKSTGSLKLNVAAGTLLFAPDLPSTPRPASLTIAPGASLDLTSNSLILNYTGTSPFPTIRQYLTAHQLYSSTADADPDHLLTLACVEASALLRLTGTQTATWSGQTVDATSLLLRPAPAGDANLDGTINADDYTLLDRSFADGLPAPNWTSGDFNYDGTVDQADYLLIDTTYGHAQGFSPGFLSMRESQFGTDYVSSLLASVPEPSSSACFFAALPFLSRRRARPARPI